MKVGYPSKNTVVKKEGDSLKKNTMVTEVDTRTCFFKPQHISLAEKGVLESVPELWF